MKRELSGAKLTTVLESEVDSRATTVARTTVEERLFRACQERKKKSNTTPPRTVARARSWQATMHALLEGWSPHSVCEGTYLDGQSRRAPFTFNYLAPINPACNR